MALFLKKIPCLLQSCTIIHMRAGFWNDSLRVARKSAIGQGAVRSERGKSKVLSLLALVHDIGKLKVYRKEKLSDAAPAPSPLEGKKGSKGRQRKVCMDCPLHVNQEVINKLFSEGAFQKVGHNLSR